MLTNLTWPISNLRGKWDYTRHRDYTIDKHGVMAQKAEKKLLKIINEWLCNVQLFPKVWILQISIKTFRITGSVSGSHLKAVFRYPYPVANSQSCRISNRQTGQWSSLAEMSGLWNFSVRVQSWSDKIESDPVLIHKIFENLKSDPVLIRQSKTI